MRWARDVIAPLLVASAPRQARCFSAGNSHLPPSVSSTGWRWRSQHPADCSQRDGKCFWGVKRNGCRSHRNLHHERHVRAVSALRSLQVMSAGSAEGDAPMAKMAVAASVAPTAATRYTIDVGVHPDVASLAVKHARRLPQFLEHYPISSHTKVAYSEAVAFVREFYHVHHGSSTGGELERQRQGEEQEQRQRHPLPVVLDSGCGTGRSSVLLAKSHPHLPVIGVDRSAVRLSKRGGVAGREGSATSRHRNGMGDQEGAKQGGGDDEARAPSDVDEKKPRPPRSPGDDGDRPGKPLPDNLLLLRADLVDLWILASRDSTWEVRQHFILYPNPYPKRSQLRSRWHGHPIFPILLGLGGRVTLRSNWKSYLVETCQAVLAINDEAEKEKGQESASFEDDGAGVDREHVESGSERHDGVRSASSGLAISGGDEEVGVNGRLGRGISRETVVDSIGATAAAAAAAAAAAGLPEIPDAVAAAAASYAASARAGPSIFKPAVPASTNFEAKYVAVGEAVYELRLEPQQVSK